MRGEGWRVEGGGWQHTGVCNVHVCVSRGLELHLKPLEDAMRVVWPYPFPLPPGNIGPGLVPGLQVPGVRIR